MDENAERRKYYPQEENVPLSVAIVEAIENHERSSHLATHSLYDYIDSEALDALFTDSAELGLSVQFHIDDIVISIWSDDGVDIRVSDVTER